MISKEIKHLTIDDLINKVKGYIKNKKDLDLIREAYLFAEEKHEGQYRLTGEPYIQHPLTAAMILANMNMGPETLAAALLHDVIEDAKVSYNELKEKFGEEIADLVDGVTNLSMINFSTKYEYEVENYKKIFIGLSKDVRVIIIKLADRLHNMRTLFIHPVEKQKNIAKATLEIFAPIAHRLGIHNIKTELEELSLYYLKPDIYEMIEEGLREKKEEREIYVQKMIKEIEKVLKPYIKNFEIKGRAKSIYSIYKKMDKKSLKLSQIYDLYAIRILVDKIEECYSTIGLIHNTWKPVPGRFKDYIAMPKPNMYQSLHTIIVGVEGKLFEIQIRTHEMDLIAEHGVAAHWAYKENKNLVVDKEQDYIKEKLSWFKHMLELQEETEEASEFIETMKSEVFNANVYVFTPKGKVIDLPKGATPIDFAYRIHTDIGHKMVGATVNDEMVTLDYELKTGDVVHIKTSKNSPGPSEDWINIAVTQGAKNRIKQFFARQRKEQNINSGRNLFEKEIRNQGLSITEITNSEGLKKVIEELKYKDINDLYHAIGSGAYTAKQILNKILKPEEILSEPEIIDKINTQVREKEKITDDILVKGADNLKVNLANCCSPILGDEIIGYVTKTSGITVHRTDCQNVKRHDKKRQIEVSWNPKAKEKNYEVKMRIYALDRPGLIFDLTSIFAANNTNITNINAKVKISAATIDIFCTVKDLAQFNKLVANINKIDAVQSVERVIR